MTWRRQYAAAWGLGLGLWASACDDEPAPLTQIVVVVNSDLSVPSKLDKVAIEVTGLVGDPAHAEVDIGEQQSLPVSLGLIHKGGPLGPVTVRAVGSLGTQAITARAATVSFAGDQTLELQLLLAEDCSSCLNNDSCAKTTCNTAKMPNLPPFDGDIASVDRMGRAGAGGGTVYSRDAGAQDAGTGGAGTVAADSGTPSNLPPVCTISEPADGASFEQGTTVRFSGKCVDPEGAHVYVLRWSSDRDGTLSYLDFALESKLSVGTHVISFCGSEPFNLDVEGCTSIDVTITAP